MEELQIRKELQKLFENIVKHSSLRNKTDEEISRTIKDSLIIQLNKVKDKLKSTKFMTISEAEGKIVRYKEEIEKLNKMIELFEEEFEIFITNYHTEQTIQEKIIARREKLSSLIVDIHKPQKPTEEILKEIRMQAQEKYPLQDEK